MRGAVYTAARGKMRRALDVNENDHVGLLGDAQEVRAALHERVTAARDVVDAT